jgi:hypothetical protein
MPSTAMAQPSNPNRAENSRIFLMFPPVSGIFPPNFAIMCLLYQSRRVMSICKSALSNMEKFSRFLSHWHRKFPKISKILKDFTCGFLRKIWYNQAKSGIPVYISVFSVFV